jgi:hypothetical protein
MTKHALISASASARWIACPGSIALSQGKPDNSSEAARWGTACHELSAWCLDTGVDAEAFRGRVIDVEGEKYEVDSKMIDCAQAYIDIVNGFVETTGGQLLVEQRVDYSAIVGVPDSFGTADAIILAGKTIYVIDLKTGQRGVDAKGNTQLKLYGLGALEEFGLVEDFEDVVLVIVQPPKSKEPSVSEVTVEELQTFGRYAAKSAQQAAALIDVTDISEIEPHLRAGPHCHNYYCKARSVCPKLRASVAEAVFEDLDALEAESVASGCSTPAAVPSDAEHLAGLLAQCDLIEGWCKEIRAAAFDRAMSGEELPGFKIVQGRAGARAWTDETAAEAALKAMRLKQDEMYKQSLQSPTQIEKILKDSPRRWNKVLPLIGKAEGKPTLVPASDKREAIRVNVAEDFDVVEDEAVDDLV